MPKLYVSNKDESVKMFKSDFLELFTHVHPVVPHVIYLPLTCYMAYMSVENKVAFLAALLLFLLGLFLWTLTEYVLHRFVFHFHPKTAFGQKIFFVFHGVHHDYPNDSKRLVMPPAVSIPLAIIFYFLFRGIVGAHFLPPFFGGFLIGYLVYDTSHYAFHHFRVHGKTLEYLKRHHTRHHYMNPDINYGVSSPLWDFVFGTYHKATNKV
jgi:sterol desaturase/sphingolipid hydroxylase (fatty acid hydroxylase superfamily)